MTGPARPVRHALRGPALLPPQWFNRVRHGTHDACVNEAGSVNLYGQALHFAGAPLAVGVAVRVWISMAGHFVCASLEDLTQEEAQRRLAEQAEQQARNQRLDAARADAEQFNARLQLPVRWDVGIKDVLSGLSETSMGHGRNRATVEHVYLLEALQAGRLRREAGDFLCTAASGTNGRNWSGKRVERFTDGKGQPYAPKVTCAACLTLAARWMNDANPESNDA